MRSSSIAPPTIARRPTTSPAASATCSTGLTEYRLEADRRGRQCHRARGRRRHHQPRAGGPVRAVGRAARKPPPELRRIRPSSRAMQGGRREARARLPRRRHVARQDPRRAADHAQGPLQDHAQLHAQGRQPRARHDAPHLHHPDQPRLFERGRHGEEIPGRAGASAGRHRVVRQLAVHRRQAQRLQELSQPYLGGHRPRPHRHAAVRVRGRVRVRALLRLCARCADVLRLPRRQLYRRRGRELPRFPRRQAAAAAGREAGG